VNLSVLRAIAASMKAFDFTAALQLVNHTHLKTMLVCYHIPNFYRKSFTTIEKNKINPLFALVKGNPLDFGFELSSDKNHYKINQEFGKESAGEFKLDQERIAKLTSVV